MDDYRIKKRSRENPHKKLFDEIKRLSDIEMKRRGQWSAKDFGIKEV